MDEKDEKMSNWMASYSRKERKSVAEKIIEQPVMWYDEVVSLGNSIILKEPLV